MAPAASRLNPLLFISNYKIIFQITIGKLVTPLRTTIPNTILTIYVQRKTLREVIKNLLPTIPVEDIIQEIEEIGHYGKIQN